MQYHPSACGRSCPVRSLVLGSALAVSLGGLAGAAGAQVINEDLKILPADGAMNDQVGYAAGLGGDILVLGAIGDSDVLSDAGSAYLFDLTIDTPNGALLHELRARDADAGTGDNFGIAVSIENGLVAVGANADDDLGDSSGSAYLFDAGSGTQLFKLLANDGAAFDLFGSSVSVDGVLVAVGAHGDSDQGTASGSVYLFDSSIETNDNGTITHKLTANDGQASDWFGYAVAMDAGLVVVGAHGDDDGGAGSGSAYVFDAVTGQQLWKLTASDAAAGDRFGTAVAVSNGVAVIGAPGDDTSIVDAGSAYLFDASTGLELGKLTAGDPVFNQGFGQSVAIDGDLVTVGAPQDDDSGSFSGSVYVFRASTGNQTAKMRASDGTAGDRFGWSVAVEGDTIAAGAWSDDAQGVFAGSAYVTEFHCPADVNGDGVVDNGDIGAFITLFLAGSPAADFNGDSIVDNGDIIAFIAAFLSGC